MKKLHEILTLKTTITAVFCNFGFIKGQSKKIKFIKMFVEGLKDFVQILALDARLLFTFKNVFPQYHNSFTVVIEQLLNQTIRCSIIFQEENDQTAIIQCQSQWYIWIFSIALYYIEYYHFVKYNFLRKAKGI